MVKYTKEFEKQALPLSDVIGVKKGIRTTGNQLLHDCRLEKSEEQQGKEIANRIGLKSVERERT